MAGEGVPDLIKSFSWIIGNWESTSAEGSFPTIKDFKYNEKLEFKTCGKQPLLAYSGSSSHPVNGNPMHLESGFLRSRGDGNVSFMVAHNFGLATVEEGKASGKSIKLTTSSVGRMAGGADPAVLRIDRKFTLQDDGTLLQEMAMSTTKTPDVTDHLKAVYKRSE